MLYWNPKLYKDKLGTEGLFVRGKTSPYQRRNKRGTFRLVKKVWGPLYRATHAEFSDWAENFKLVESEKAS